MFLIRRPSAHTIERFAEASRTLPLSYRPIGIATGSPAGYDLDETSVVIGRGDADFACAKTALAAWTQFNLGWVEVFPRAASLAPDTGLAVLIRHFGLWSLNGCRVVYALGDRVHGPTFGYAYGTVTSHAEQGEEVFEVFLRPETEEVVYRIRAVSRPRALLAWLGYPAVRVLQARFRRDSGEAMRQAVARGR